MGRHCRLLPNLNVLLLQLHLPSYHHHRNNSKTNKGSTHDSTVDDHEHHDHDHEQEKAATMDAATVSSSLTASFTASSSTEETHHGVNPHHPHHSQKRHHLFSWPSYRHKSRHARQQQHRNELVEQEREQHVVPDMVYVVAKDDEQRELERGQEQQHVKTCETRAASERTRARARASRDYRRLNRLR